MDTLRHVTISGKGSVTIDALNLLAKAQVDVVIIDSRGEITAKVTPMELRTAKARREHYCS